jgi:OOP family OmpA-OmpF porin
MIDETSRSARPRQAISAGSPGLGGSTGRPLPQIEEVQFGFDSARLDAAATRALDRVIDKLRSADASTAFLVGHADNTGPVSYNRWLSAQRAETVAEYLLERGIDTDRVRSGNPNEAVLSPAEVPGPVSKRSVQIIILEQP